MRLGRIDRIGCLLLLAGFLTVGTARAEVDYVTQIKPLFEKRCYACHGAFKQNGGLRLDTGASIRQGGDSGPAAMPQHGAQSLLVQVLTGEAGFRMPPENEGSHWSADDIALVRRWIDEGAASPADEMPAADPRTYWSYQPVERHAVPSLHDSSDGLDPIDAFLADKHREHGLTPGPAAEPAVLLRRLYLDLIGLPPTPAEIETFLADDRPDAVHRVVDQLLTNPLYGQRWGRHWMDVWRYSDWYGSRGSNEIRYSQRHIWRWRDWIVESLNEDVGYDAMLTAMLAGDELAPGNHGMARATGFLARNWYKFDRNVWMFDTVEHTSQAFLGLTMKCARCHDHKFDPILQKDYFRLRAFFEPHDVRTDPVTFTAGTQKDAKLGEIPTDGVSYVYDKQPDVPTYLFARGDGRFPVESEPLSPGFPESLGGTAPRVEPISLPAEVVAPALREEVVNSMLAHSREQVVSAEKHLEQSRKNVERWQGQLAAIAAGMTPTQDRQVLFHDDFQEARPDVWEPRSGDWKFESGKLIQARPGAFDTLVAKVHLPEDFAMRLRYRTLEPGSIHSVGLFFDATDLGNCQAIYTAHSQPPGTVQAFHRTGGTEHYPAAGIFPCEIKLNELTTMEIAVRGAQLNVWIDGKLRLAYRLPNARRPGQFALWNHSASSEFYEVHVESLASEFVLATSVQDGVASPLVPPTEASLRIAAQNAEREVGLAQQKLETEQAREEWARARVAAERAKLAGQPDAAELAKQAGSAERNVKWREAIESQSRAEQALAHLQNSSRPEDPEHAKTLKAAEEKVATEIKKVAAALAQRDQESAEYMSLGQTYPAISSGRRLALAKWITDPGNPRTARVGVNHIWLRHFGEAIVPSVSNFGLNGQRPSHPELLDWLAGEFVQHGWSMKRLHRRLVTTAGYARSSRDGGMASNVERDPANRYLWRMNSHRLESEAIRDSVLHLAGELDLTFGGPELDQTTGLESRRRSLYFRITPNEKMMFLELFDQANPNECYRRQESVVPQQSLALWNSSLAIQVARKLVQDLPRLAGDLSNADLFLEAAFAKILGRGPTSDEREMCRKFLERHRTLVEQTALSPFPAANPRVPAAPGEAIERASANLLHVLLNHNDFVTVR